MTEPPAISERPQRRTAYTRIESTEAHSSGLSIIASKISPAAPARSILPRPRLVDWLEQQAHARLILVSAEAGYGKSTLLNDFALQTRDTCVWYRMETSDGDWITFLSYMVAALRDVWPEFGRSTEALLRNVAAMGSSREVVLAQFLADLGSAEERRVAVILDDYHLVEECADIRMILSRMLERAPDDMYFILGGRGVPNLALGRLRAQGRVSEMTIDDLRFTLDEVEQLYSITYGQPLDAAACRIIADRTEGWAASLQLIAASIAVSQPNEVAGFIAALSGATGRIYDFLAEEVLTRLTPQTQRILMHASLIDRIQPEYVAAALEASGWPTELVAVERAFDDAESLGLLGGRSQTSGGRRMHRLFRDFLQVHLERDVPADGIRAMHRHIAREAEPKDWLMAARHYAQAAADAEAMRVLGSAASEALGTGAWGTAVEILDLIPQTPPPAAVKVIQARALISDEHPETALSILTGVDRSELTAEERGLVGLTCAAIHHMNGESEQLKAEIETVVSDTDVPAPLHDIAVSWRLILEASRGGCISDAVKALRRLAIGQRQSGLHYFAGVTLHNSATAELARGNYRQAHILTREAIAHLERTEEGSTIRSSTRSVEAAAVAELGNLEEGLRTANAAATEPGATADAIAEAAYLHAVCGLGRRARSLLAKFERGDARWAHDPTTHALGCYARFALAMTEGRISRAGDVLEELATISSYDFDAQTREAVLAATLAVVDGSADAGELTQLAVGAASSQNAWRWMARARILDAVLRRDGESLAQWINEAEGESSLAILELADAIATAIGTLAPLPEALERSILREPTRWVTALNRQVQGRPSEDASAAASLIARYGTADDVSVLREFDRAPDGKSKKRGLATQLIRRVSPTVRVHDLGLTNYEIGDRRVTLTETRRKPAALLLYLITRTRLASTKEQVMDSLWPDQSPRSAMNSLHQTLFFLRRDIEPWYEDGATAEYVHMESDLVRLDQELFQVDSVAFARQAKGILSSKSAASQGPEMLALYQGGFAPEFEYEEWAEGWRTHVHTVFLHLAHATASALLGEGRFADVVEVLTPVAAMDPTVYDLRATLVGCLAAVGATDAAQAHYRSMAAAYERDLGLPARAFEEIVQGPMPAP